MNYYTTTTTVSSADALGMVSAILAGMIIWILVFLALAILIMVARWKMLKKAGKDGWIAFVPNYVDVVELEISGVPGYYWFFNYAFALVSIIPVLGTIVSIVGLLGFSIWKSVKLAKVFGKSTVFGVLLVFFPFVMYPILGFGGAEYVGPASAEK